MSPEKPLRHQRQLACERLAIVGSELGRYLLPTYLDIGEHAEGITVQLIWIVTGVEPGKVMRPPEVLEKQQPAVDISLVHVRNVRPQGLQQPRHLQIGANIFLAGRRVHDHQCGAIVKGAKIAPEACVGGGRLDPLRPQSQLARQPFVYKRQSRVGLGHAVSSLLAPSERRRAIIMPPLMLRPNPLSLIALSLGALTPIAHADPSCPSQTVPSLLPQQPAASQKPQGEKGVTTGGAVSVEAERTDYDVPHDTAIFTGHVVIRQGD